MRFFKVRRAIAHIKHQLFGTGIPLKYLTHEEVAEHLNIPMSKVEPWAAVFKQK